MASRQWRDNAMMARRPTMSQVQCRKVGNYRRSNSKVFPSCAYIESVQLPKSRHKSTKDGERQRKSGERWQKYG